MATQTTNLGMTLPDGTENVSRAVLNGNFEIIDEAVGALPSGKTFQEQIDDINDEIGNTSLPTTAQTLTGAIAEHETDLGGKADKVSVATNGNFAGLDNNGNITDSGSKSSDFIPATAKGAASGVASLDSNGKIPSSELPSMANDVIEGYYYNGAFYEEASHTTAITGETGKIYIDLATNNTYRYTGSSYATLSASAEKADKVSGATSGNFAGLDSNGNLTDSGSKSSDFVPVTDIATELETQAMIDDYYAS